MAELRLSTWGIKNPIPVILAFAALVLAGAISYASLPIKQFPNVVLPGVTLTVTENGAAASEMETQVTRPIEDALAGIAGIEDIQSEVGQGVSTTLVDFDLDQNPEKVTEEARSRVEQARINLPREIDPPTVTQFELDSQPIMTFAVSAPDMTPEQLSWFIDDTISRSLQAEQGVAQISRVGGVDREINILVDPDKLAARGLTADALNAALVSFNVDVPGGRLDVGGREQIVRVLGSAKTVDQLRNLTIPTVGGQFVKLSDVADVGDGASEPRGFARLDDRPVVGFQVLKTNAASDVQTESNVLTGIDKLRARFPNVRFTGVYSTVSNTRASFAATLRTMFEGMFLAALVVWLFLRDWRSTAIVAIAMPVSLIPTFVVMKMLGYSLNVVTLLALTLVIGILIDDAIVEIENIQKRIQAGARPYRAAMEGADQIGLAVVATTAAIVVVFAPVSFMGSIPGQFFKEFGLTVVVSVLFSLLVARLLTPLLAAYFLRPTEDPKPRGPLNPTYSRILDWALSHRLATAALGLAIFAGAIVLAMVALPVGLNPPDNPDYMFVNVDGPPGATLGDMERISRDATALLRAHIPETDAVFAQVGSTSGEGFAGGAGAGGLSSGTITVILKHHRAATVSQISDRILPYLHEVPDARISFPTGGFGAASVQTVLTSQDGANLDRAGDELLREMRGLPDLADPRPSATPPGPEIIIRPKPEEAARLGVTVESIASTARIATLGDINANVPKLDQGQRRIPIRVRLPAADRTDIDVINSLQVPTASGATTPLRSVADVDFEAGASVIERFARQRMLRIDADLVNGAQLGEGLHEVSQLPIMRHLPPGVEPQTQGNEARYKEMFSSLGMAIATGILLIYGVLVLLFRSFFKPVTILTALPLAIGGAIIALMVTGLSLSLPSLIGLLMLLGVAAKNSILLVEYAIERERAGVPQREAIMEACRERARPIIMTTMAMGAGMLPTAFAIGAGSAFRQPMAVAVIGGLITSTALSLVMVPVVYEMVDDFEGWLTPRFGRLITPREAPPAAVPEDQP